MTTKHVDIVFDGPPGPEAGRFVEVEDENRRSIRFGEWIKRDDGYWVLRMESQAETVEHLRRELKYARDLLDSASSGYISGSGPDEEWEKRRDGQITDIDKILGDQP